MYLVPFNRDSAERVTFELSTHLKQEILNKYYLLSSESFWPDALFKLDPQVAQLAMLHNIVNSFDVNPHCSKYCFPT